MQESEKNLETITQEEAIKNIHSLNSEPYYGSMTVDPDSKPLLYIPEIQNPIDWNDQFEYIYPAFQSMFGEEFWKWEKNRKIQIEYTKKPVYREGKNKYENLRVIQRCLDENRFELTITANELEATLIIFGSELESVQDVRISEVVNYNNRLYALVWSKFTDYFSSSFDKYINYDGSEFDTTPSQIKTWRKTLIEARKTFEQVARSLEDEFHSKN
jgi:hypothetical protein